MTFQRALTFLLAAGIFLCACKKPTLDDTALIPDDNLGLNYTDTLSLKTTVVEDDSIDVSGATLALLGSMNDPLLGSTHASFYIPFTLRSNNFAFDDTTVTLDSVALMLWYYPPGYGDWRVPQTVEVYERAEDIVDSVNYFSDQTFAVKPNPVGTKTFIPNTKDTLKINGITYPPSLRIRLSNSFGEKFTSASGTADFADAESFRAFFKGLYITTSRGGGGLGVMAFDPFVGGVQIVVYCHDVEGNDTSNYFPALPDLVVNHYEHDYRSVQIHANEDSVVYIQGLAGLYTKVVVPNLRNLGNILINKAELEVTVLPESLDNDTVFTPPAKLTLLMSDSLGNFNGITPDQSFPSTIFGGNKEEDTDSVTNEKLIKYKFSLSRYYQQVASGERKDFGIFILPDKRYQVPDRIVAGGGGNSKYALKLNLVYDIIE